MVLSETESSREPERRQADLKGRGRRRDRFGHQHVALVVPDGIDHPPYCRREEQPPRDDLDAEERTGGVLLGMIDVGGRAGAGRSGQLQALAVRVRAVEREVGGEGAHRDRRQRRLHAEEQPAFASLAVLELARAERDEVEEIGVAFVADDRGGGRVQARLALEPGGDLQIAALASRFDRHDLGLLRLDHGVEGVDHLLRIEQRIEPVVGAKLEQLVELPLRLLSFTGEQVGDAQDPVRLDHLALAVEQHVGVEQRVQEIDGALVLRPPERRSPAIEGFVRRAALLRRAGGGRDEERAGQRGQEPDAHSADAPVFNFTTWVSRSPARTRIFSVENASPASTATSISLLESSSVKKGTSISSPGRPAVAASLRLGSLTSTRAVATAGSVVTSRCAGRHLRRRAMIASAGSGWSGPISTRSTKQQPLGLRSSSTWSTFQGTAIVVWSGA